MYQSPYPFINATRSIGTSDLKKVIGKNDFKNPKNVEVLKKWISIVSGYNKKAVILDFFAGSGTTAQAVAELNYEDNGSRECLLITTNENNLVDIITIPRIERVLSGNWDDKTIQHPKLTGKLNIHRREVTSS